MMREIMKLLIIGFVIFAWSAVVYGAYRVIVMPCAINVFLTGALLLIGLVAILIGDIGFQMMEE